MKAMTREQIQKWKAGWKAASEKVAELQALASPEERLRQLEAARLMALSMGWGKSLHAEDELVRERWNHIRRAWLEKHGSR